MSTERRFPPVVACAVVALGCVVVGGVVLASYAPRRPSLTLPGVLLTTAVALFGVSLLMLARIQGFAWGTFWKVARWALLAYAISAAMIEFAFVQNDTSGAPLAVVTGMLVMYAVIVPEIIATTVARYADG